MAVGKRERPLDQQISAALAAVRASKNQLITLAELPEPWRYNSHVLTGYRFYTSSRQCVRSIFAIHNESFNIWSHILGCLLIAWLFFHGRAPETVAADGPSSVPDGLLHFVYYTYLLAAVLCTACSVGWHTMRCSSSYATISLYSRLDLMGVTTLVIASVVVTQLVAFAGSSSAATLYQYLYMGIAALASCWLPVMYKSENSWQRIGIWIGLGVQGAQVPAGWSLWTRGIGTTATVYSLLLPAYAPIVFGAVIYASQFPECCWPGRFDYLGASHNILHVAALWAIWMGIEALRNLPRHLQMVTS